MAKAKKTETSYKTGEACKELDVQPYVLRYWETEFPMISGKKSGAQKVYSEQDLAVLRRIKELLYDEGYTIAGAKKRIEVELEDGEVGDVPRSAGRAEADTEDAEEKSAGAKRSKPTSPGDDESPSLDTPSRQSIESVLPELRRLHREAMELLELVRG